MTAGNEFKGRDRRLLSQTWRNLWAVILRDQRTLDPKETTSLSNRDLILDNNFTPIGDSYAANVLLIQLRLDYFLPNQTPAYSGPWPPPVGS